MLFSIPSAYSTIAVHAGETHAVHEKTLQYVYSQYCVPTEGQSDCMVVGVPFIMPYNVNSVLNPLLVHCLVLGYVFNMYRGMPLVKKNGVLIMTHPLYARVRLAAPHLRTTKSSTGCSRRPRTRSRCARSTNWNSCTIPTIAASSAMAIAYHGVHPLFMWYWGQNGRHHVGKVIVVGAEDPRTAPRMGWENAATMEEALEMAHSHVGHKPIGHPPEAAAHQYG